jgi:hypothetical protein
MKYTLKDLEDRFHIKRHEAGMFFLMLAMMPPGGAFEAINGRIEKIDESTLKIDIDEETLMAVANEFMDESVIPYDDMFGHLPLD